MNTDSNNVIPLVPPSEALAANRSAPLALANIGGTRLATTEDKAEWIAYRVAGTGYLAPHAQVSEISEMLPVFRLPNSGRGLLGLINLHGNLVPVFDLASAAGGTQTTLNAGMLLVLGHGAAAAAVVVDEIPARRRFGKAERINVPAISPAIRDFVPSAYQEEERVWLEFDHARFFEFQSGQLSS